MTREPKSGKTILSQRDMSSDAEIFTFSRLDHKPESSGIDLLLTPRKQRQNIE